MKIRLDKELTRKLVVTLAPEYAEMLQDLRSNASWAKLQRKYEGVFHGPLLETYATIFDDERKIGVVLWLFLLGEEGHKDLNAEIDAMSTDEQKAWMNDLVSEACEDRGLGSRACSLTRPRRKRQRDWCSTN